MTAEKILPACPCYIHKMHLVASRLKPGAWRRSSRFSRFAQSGAPTAPWRCHR